MKILWWILPLLAAGLWYPYYYTPQTDQTALLQGQKETLQREVAEGLAAKEALPDFSRAYLDWIKRLEFDQKRIPKRESISVLVKQIGDLAQQNNLSLQTLGRSYTEGPEQSRATNLAISVTGGWSNVFGFLQDLEDSVRFLSAKDLNFEFDGTLRLGFNLSAYTMPYVAADPNLATLPAELRPQPVIITPIPNQRPQPSPASPNTPTTPASPNTAPTPSRPNPPTAPASPNTPTTPPVPPSQLPQSSPTTPTNPVITPLPTQPLPNPNIPTAPPSSSLGVDHG